MNLINLKIRLKKIKNYEALVKTAFSIILPIYLKFSCIDCYVIYFKGYCIKNDEHSNHVNLQGLTFLVQVCSRTTRNVAGFLLVTTDGSYSFQK